MSTDVSMLEEYLRSSESQGKTLRDTPGLTEAAQKVTGPGTSLFGYENQVETMRAKFDALKPGPGGATNASASALSPLPAALGIGAPLQSFAGWMDPSLLPPYEKVSKYFGIGVYGESANVDGLAFKIFFPMPPQLRGH